MLTNNKQRTLFLIFACSLVFSITLYFWITRDTQPTPGPPTTGNSSTVAANPTQSNSPTSSPNKTSSQNPNISDGDKIFYNHASTEEVQILKKTRQFKEARRKVFGKEGSDFCADPELLIYKNNQEIADKDPYTIAVAAPIGIKNYEDNKSALEMLRGVAQAQSKINQEPNKINGKSLRIVIASDRDNKTTPQLAESLANDREVLGVVGHDSSNSTIEATKVYKENKLVAISSSSTSMEINPKGDNPYFFRTVPNNQDEAKILADYMLNKLNITNYAILWDDEDSYSISLKEEFAKIVLEKTGRNPLLYERRDFIERDDFAQTAFNKGVRAFILTINVDSMVNSLGHIKDSPDEEAQQFYYLAGDAVYGGKKVFDERFKNMVIAVAWHQSDALRKSASTESKTFVEQGKELWCQTEDRERITWRTATAYDATNLFIFALKETSKNDSTPTREKIQEYLQTYKPKKPGEPVTSFPGVTGSISFENNGDVKNESKLVRVCETQDSKYVYKLEDLSNKNLNVNKCNL